MIENDDGTKNKYAITQTQIYARKDTQFKNTNDDLEEIENVLEELFKCSKYTSKIEQDFIDAFGDLSLSIGDMPKIIDMVINSVHLIKDLVKNTKSLDSHIVKYIIYGIIYRLVINDGKISDVEQYLLDNYQTFWNIISFKPFKMTATYGCKLFGFCC